MASFETPALKTITAHTQELVKVLSSDSDLELIAGVLLSTNFIQDDVLIKVSCDGTPTGKAAILVEAVTKMIEVAPEKFTEFLKILQENRLLTAEVVDGLLSTYQNAIDDYQSSQLIPRAHVQSEDDPSVQEIESLLSAVDNKTFKEDDWNVVLVECGSLAAMWEHLSAYLGLAKANIDSIRENRPRDSTGCWNEALSQWIKQNYSTQRFGLPSWRSLLKAVAMVDKCLFNKLATKYTSEKPSHDHFTADQSSESTEQSGQSYSETSLAMIRSNYEKINSLFSALLLNVQKALQSHSVDADDVRQFLVTFFKQEFTVAQDLGKIFFAATVEDLWNHDHYGPLEKLTEHFLSDDPSVEGLMKEYKGQLNGFHMTMKIVDFMKYQKVVIDDSDQALQLKKLTTEQYQRINVVLELNRNISELSLLYVDKLWHSIADEYKIPSLTAVLEKIVTGSIKISWLVPAHVAEMITRRVKFFRKHHIVQVFIDDVILYDEKEMVILEQQFLELCQTIATADVGLFSYFLEQGVDPDICNKHGLHPLWYASCHNRADLVQLLLHNHATVDLPTQEKVGETALVAAVNKGHTYIAEILVMNGANVNYRTKSGKSPLFYASYLGHTEAVLLLLHHHAEVDLPNDDERGETALFAACSQGCYDPAALLIEFGADVNYLNKQGNTPLYFASQYRHSSLVQLLLAYGADINKGVQSPLYVASFEGNMEMVQLLVHHYAAINQPCDDEFAATPLMAAIEENHLEVVRFLVSSGANVNYRTKKGMSPLLCACDCGNTDIVKLLIQVNANTELKNKEGRTALMVASWRGYLEIVMELIRAGAITDTQDQEGLTSLMLATQNGYDNVVAALLNANTNPNIMENTIGASALHIAALNGRLHITKLLLAKGADTELRTKNGLTAVEICEAGDVCDELGCHTISQNTQPTENQRSEDVVKKSYLKLLQIFDVLEDSLLYGHNQKKLHPQREIVKVNQQLLLQNK